MSHQFVRKFLVLKLLINSRHTQVTPYSSQGYLFTEQFVRMMRGEAAAGLARLGTSRRHASQSHIRACCFLSPSPQSLCGGGSC